MRRISAGTARESVNCNKRGNFNSRRGALIYGARVFPLLEFRACPHLTLEDHVMAVTEQQIQDALKELTDPNTRKDYVTSKSAKNIKVDGDKVSLDVVLGYPAKSQIEPIRKEITAKLKSLPGVGSGERQRHDENRSARRAARRETRPRRAQHHRGGVRQGRRRQEHDRRQPRARARGRRCERRRAGRGHLWPVAAHDARASAVGPRRRTARSSSRWKATACRRCRSAS